MPRQSVADLLGEVDQAVPTATPAALPPHPPERAATALNRQRGGEGERITENTLIRVAVDMLLGQAGRLRGTTEDELRKSVTS